MLKPSSSSITQNLIWKMSWKTSKKWERFPHCQSCISSVHWSFFLPGGMFQCHHLSDLTDTLLCQDVTIFGREREKQSNLHFYFSEKSWGITENNALVLKLGSGTRRPQGLAEQPSQPGANAYHEIVTPLGWGTGLLASLFWFWLGLRELTQILSPEENGIHLSRRLFLTSK